MSKNPARSFGGAQQRVSVLGGTVSLGDCAARGPDQGKGSHALHHALQEGVASEGSQMEVGGSATSWRARSSSLGQDEGEGSVLSAAAYRQWRPSCRCLGL